MKDATSAFIGDVIKNRKTYLAAAGLVGLALYQLSQEDYLTAAATVGGALTLLKNKVSEK